MSTRAVGEAMVPAWLEPLLATPFFGPCARHGDAARGECNMFCLDCPAAAAFCFSCRSAGHADHRTIQIRRSSYHDVVRVSEVQRALDISGVQTYVINSARVVFLNERPLPKGPAASGGFGVAAKSPAHACEICSRTLLDPFRFCSLGCKLQGIKKGGDACFVLGAEGSGSEVSAAAAATAAASRRRASERTRAREGTPEQAGPASREEVKGLCGGGGARQDACPPPPPIRTRRRKGIPRRAPVTS